MLLFNSTVLYAEDFVMDEAMKAYKANNFELATNLFLTDFDHLNNLGENDKLKAAITFSKNLKIYREIYKKSLLTQVTYLETLVNSEKNNSSAYAALYLAEALYLQGDLDRSKTIYGNIDQRLIVNKSEIKHFHLIGALISHQSKWMDKYVDHRSSFNINNKRDQLFLNYIDIVLFNKNELTLEDLSAFILEDQQQNNSPHQNNHYLLKALIALNRLDLASARIVQLNKQQPAFVEQLGKTKVIRFYDLALTHTLSVFYYEMSKTLFEKIKNHKKLGDIAKFYLSDLELVLAKKENANSYQNKVKRLTLLPKTLANTIEVRSAAHGFLAGNHNRAYQTLKQAVDNLEKDPLISADAVLMCIYLQANCPTIVKNARLMAESGTSKRYTQLSLNVGRYFLSKNEITKARRLINGALFKSDNNNLFANDPILLINLAEIKRLNKNYSDSLQIYFSAAKDYPMIRQIQDAVQGEYLHEQRNSGIPTVF